MTTKCLSIHHEKKLKNHIPLLEYTAVLGESQWLSINKLFMNTLPNFEQDAKYTFATTE